MQTVTISNHRNKKENITLSVVFLLCGIVAAGWAAVITPAPIYLRLIIFFGISISWVYIYLASQKKIVKDKGSLIINLETKTFSLNDKPDVPYAALDFYDSSTIGGRTRLAPISSMYITVGSDGEVFKLNDDDGAKMLSQDDIDALTELIQGASISDDQKISFSGWCERLRIKNY